MRIYLSVNEAEQQSAYETFNELLDNIPEFQIDAQQKLILIYARNDPRLLGIWETYQVMNLIDDAKDSLEIILTISALLNDSKDEDTEN